MNKSVPKSPSQKQGALLIALLQVIVLYEIFLKSQINFLFLKSKCLNIKMFKENM